VIALGDSPGGNLVNVRHWLRRLSGPTGSAVALAALLFAHPVQAQQQPAGEQKSDESSAKPATQNGDQNKEKPQTQQSGVSNDRLFWTLPNYLTLENAGQVPPLTVGQKFKLEAKSAFDYVEFPWIGLLAGISQAENSEPSYGQGAEGYGKRYATAFADGTIENFMTSAVLPSMLHQDPRYYQLGKGGFWHRTGYAVERIFVTRTDSGDEQFNYSEIIGSSTSAFISTYSYHPQDDRNVSNAMSVWGTQVGIDTLTFVVKEFWPDIKHKFSHKHPQE